jgi:alkyl sulfatase BDS1-like metallo-beta-lactamase superfamily hydrolase
MLRKVVKKDRGIFAREPGSDICGFAIILTVWSGARKLDAAAMRSRSISFAARTLLRGVMTVCAIVFALSAHSALAQEAKPAQPDVAAANKAVLSQLPFGDRQDFEDANRGFIATIPDLQNQSYAFVKGGPAPATVNPSLWRQAQLDTANGLFKVTDGVYQVRNFSASEMTIVEGRTGIILIDTLASPAAARIALDLYYAHRPRKTEARFSGHLLAQPR